LKSADNNKFSTSSAVCLFKKLLIIYETIAGFSIITDIEYDGESIDKGDYSTFTKELSLNVNQNQ